MLKTHPHVEQALAPIKEALDAGKHLALMLDYDGTLTPIVSNPKEAQLDMEGLQRLQALSKRPEISIALISGRSVEQLQDYMDWIFPAPILLMGLHGGQAWEAQHGKWLQEPVVANIDMKQHFAEKVEAALNELGKGTFPEGIHIEDKGYTFALHYRNVGSELIGETAHDLMKDLFNNDDEMRISFRLQEGHKVIEIVPSHFNKGAGVLFCLEYWKYRGKKENIFPLFAGDDKTDEPGLQAAIDGGGVAIAIGVDPQDMQGINGDDRAKLYTLSNPNDMHQLLQGILDHLN